MRMKVLIIAAALAAGSVLAFAGVAAATTASHHHTSKHILCDRVGRGEVLPFPLDLFAVHGVDVRIYLGTLALRDGDELTLTVARSICATSGRTTLSIPSAASVRRDGQPATLDALQPGDGLAVLLTQHHGNYVWAGDRAYLAQHGVHFDR